MYTADAQRIEHGMRVWTITDNFLEKGTVDLNTIQDDGWFEVLLDSGHRISKDRFRITVFHPFTMEKA